MTVDKEAILRKHVSTITFGKLIGTPMAQVFEAMDEYSSSLLKENEELKAWKESAMLVMSPVQEIGAVIGVKFGESILEKVVSAIQAKDREIEFLNQNCDNLMNEITQLKESLSSTEKAYEIMRDKSEYWKARCGAAEEILKGLGITDTFKFNHNEDNPPKPEFENSIKKWQQLKQQPIK